MPMYNLIINGKIFQIDPHKMTLKQCLKIQKPFIEQHGYKNYLRFCYCSIIGDLDELDEQQYEYYLHELYDDYPIF